MASAVLLRIILTERDREITRLVRERRWLGEVASKRWRTAQHWDRLAKNQPAEIAMFQISEVQEAPAFNGRRSFLALRGRFVGAEMCPMDSPESSARSPDSLSLVLGLNQRFQQIIKIALQAFTQHKAVLAWKAAGVIAGPEDQVVSSRDHNQLGVLFHRGGVQ